MSSPCSDTCPAQCGDAFPLVDADPTLQQLADELIARGVRRVHVLAWRDLDDPDAGGSEVHADEFMRRWAAAGLEITHRTSAAAGQPAVATRNGYRVIRRGSRYSVFPRAVGSEWIRHMGRYDALVEVWNGVPWMSPLWCRRPHITFLHHVHGPMWDQLLPKPLAGIGRALEARFAPPFYRRTLTLRPVRLSISRRMATPYASGPRCAIARRTACSNSPRASMACRVAIFLLRCSINSRPTRRSQPAMVSSSNARSCLRDRARATSRLRHLRSAVTTRPRRS